jgi:hypothetical protein
VCGAKKDGKGAVCEYVYVSFISHSYFSPVEYCQPLDM